MDEEILLTDYTKSILLFVIAYVCVRISKFGEEKVDRTVVLASGIIILLTMVMYAIFRRSEILTSIFLVSLGWSIVIMWMGKIPGLRLRVPESQRVALLIEFAVIVIAAFIAVNIWG